MSPAVERLRAEIRSDRDAVFRWLDELGGLALGPATPGPELAQAARATADLDRLDRWLSEIARSYPST